MEGRIGEIRVAGLPMRATTPAKEQRVRTQALLTVATMLETARVAQIFNPDANPLIPYLLVDGQHTIAEAIQQKMLLGAG